MKFSNFNKDKKGPEPTAPPAAAPPPFKRPPPRKKAAKRGGLSFVNLGESEEELEQEAPPAQAERQRAFAPKAKRGLSFAARRLLERSEQHRRSDRLHDPRRPVPLGPTAPSGAGATASPSPTAASRAQAPLPSAKTPPVARGRKTPVELKQPTKQPLPERRDADQSVDPKYIQDLRRRAHKVYGCAIQTVKELFRDVETMPLRMREKLESVSRDILEEITWRNSALLALTSRSTANNYLYAHTVNVTILSMQLGYALGWDPDRLTTLGIVALLHDIGMIKYLHIAQQARRLTQAEYEKLKQHPIDGQRLLHHIHDIEDALKQTISEVFAQVYDRGKGPPKRFEKMEDLHIAAEIIGITDMYESLTHYRSWREALLPHETMKALVKTPAAEFNSHLTKLFLEQLSLYPPGSYVELSTGEIACVIEPNPQMPTRPVIEVRVKADLTPQDPPLPWNLELHPVIHIAKAVDETKLVLKDKRLLMQLQAGRWWAQ